MKIVFFIALLLLSFTITHAQEFITGVIRGKLMDEQKSTQPYVSILLRKSADSILYKSQISSDDGAFLFDFIAEGNYFMEIKMIGFEKRTNYNIEISKTNPEIDFGNIVLATVAKSLGEVTITADKPFIERQIDKTVVNIENSIVNAGSSAMEIMQKLPGVQVKQDGQINLNGKSGVSIYIDGRATLLSSDDLANLLKSTPAASIQKIEIIAKPSAKYDAAGSGGIINIVRTKNRKEGFNAGISGGCGYGRRGKYNGSIDLSFKGENYNLFINSGYTSNNTIRESTSTIDFLKNETLKNEFISNNYEQRTNNVYTPSLGIDYYISPKTTLSLSANGMVRNFNSNTNSLSDEFDQNRNKIKLQNFTNISEDGWFNYSGNIHLAHHIDTSGKEITMDLDYSDYWNNSDQRNTTLTKDPAGSFIDQSNMLLLQSGKLNIYAAKADYTQPLKKNMHLEAGLKSSYVSSLSNNDFYDRIAGKDSKDSSRGNYFKYSENINAAYLNINKAYKKVTVQLGLRAEQTVGKGEQLFTKQVNKQNYLQLFPSFFADYKLNDNNSLNVNFGRRIDRPAYADKNPLRRILNPIYYTQGDPNIQPQLSYNNSLTYSYKDEFSAAFEYTYFRNYLAKTSFPDVDSNTNGTKPVNINRSSYYNLELVYTKKLIKWWTTNNSFLFYYQLFNGNTSNFAYNNHGIPSFYFSTNNSFSLNDKLSTELTFWYEHKYQEGFSIFKSNCSLTLGIKRMFFNSRASIVISFSDVFWSEPYNWSTTLTNMTETWYAKNDTRIVKLNFTYRFGKGEIKKVHQNSGSTEEKGRTGNQ